MGLDHYQPDGGGERAVAGCVQPTASERGGSRGPPEPCLAQRSDWGTFVWLAMVMGSRRGEICAIRWRHLDLDSRVLHLEKAIAQDGSEIWEKDTKSRRDRRIVLDERTVALLTEHWERVQQRAQALELSVSRDAFVLSLEPDCRTPLKPSSVTQRYSRLARSLAIDTHLHALRHSATELIAAGVDIRTVAGRLGHGGGGVTTRGITRRGFRRPTSVPRTVWPRGCRRGRWRSILSSGCSRIRARLMSGSPSSCAMRSSRATWLMVHQRRLRRRSVRSTRSRRVRRSAR